MLHYMAPYVTLYQTICAMCPHKIISRAKVPSKWNFANKSALFPQAAPCPISILGRTLVVVQCSFTRVCQAVPNKMLGASYTNRDVSSLQTRDLYCNGRNMYVQLSHLLFVLEMFRWYVVLDKFVSYSRRQWTSFFHNFKLELYSFCEPCPYTV